MNSIERIKGCLTRAGLFEIPSADDEPLASYGFDSLTLALTVIELEREFKFRLAPIEIKAEQFESIESISKLVGAKLASPGKN